MQQILNYEKMSKIFSYPLSLTPEHAPHALAGGGGQGGGRGVGREDGRGGGRGGGQVDGQEELFIIIDPCTRSAHWLVVYGVEVLGSLKSLLAFLSQPSDYKCIFRRD